MYYLTPRYGKERVQYNKWNYRPWPFYFMFWGLVFSHHIFLDMPNPVWLQIMAQPASLGIVFPSALTIFTAFLFIWRSQISWNITTRFFLAGLAGWAFVGYQGAEMGMWGADIYLHNTMAMPSHIHLMLLLGPLLMTFGIIYAIFPDLTKKHMSKTLGECHFWLTIFGPLEASQYYSTILGCKEQFVEKQICRPPLVGQCLGCYSSLSALGSLNLFLYTI